MHHIAIVEHQDFSKYAIIKLLEECCRKPIKCHDVTSMQELKLFLNKYKNSSIIIDGQSYQMESQKEHLLFLKQEYVHCNWLFIFDNISGGWLKRLMQVNWPDLSILLKDDSLEVLCKGLGEFLHGRTYLSDQVCDILKEQENAFFKVEQVLTQVEREVLREIASGKTNKEIAQDRSISIHTVVTHRKNIFKKLEVNNVYDASRYAIRAGIFTVNDYYI
ncbi:response regulator transcription factor [Myroides sp. LJL116]